MQPSATPSPVVAPLPLQAPRRRVFWILIAAGLFTGVGRVAQGSYVLAFSLGLGPQGFPPDYFVLQIITLAGEVLEGLGLLLGFVGIAMALRAPAPRLIMGVRGNVFWTILLGGLLLGLGAILLGAVNIAADFAPFLLSSLGFPVAYALLDATIILQAVGFFVAFFGIALGFHPRA